jgi:hypothetical protein
LQVQYLEVIGVENTKDLRLKNCFLCSKKAEHKHKMDLMVCEWWQKYMEYCQWAKGVTPGSLKCYDTAWKIRDSTLAQKDNAEDLLI